MRKAINHLKKSDPVLRAIIERVGPYRMEYGPPEFASLAESIVYQQFKLTDAQLRSVGLSKQKSAYLKDLSEKTAAGSLDFGRLPDLSDDEVIKHLTRVKGIGVWTAHMFLIFSLKRRDVLPTGDYGVQAAIKKHYRKRKLPKPHVMEKIARPWVPYRSVACWYLWRSLDIKTL